MFTEYARTTINIFVVVLLLKKDLEQSLRYFIIVTEKTSVFNL